MNSIRLLFIFITMALLHLFAASLVTAAPANQPPIPPSSPWNPYGNVDPRVLITAIDPAGGTIQFTTMSNRMPHNFRIDENTQITVNGQRGSAQQVQVGMQIQDIRFRDAVTMASFSAGRAEPPPKPQKPMTPDQLVKPPPSATPPPAAPPAQSQ
jgi:hypothetical protein